MRRLSPAVALVFLLGCPGELENPDQYPDEPLALCQLDIDVPGLFRSKCGSSTCHAGEEPAAELNLVDPGVFARIENAASTQCEGRVIVDPLEPNSSFLVDKLRGTQPVGCGERMPFVSFLTGAEIACVQRWVFEQTIGLDGGVSPVDMGTGEVDGGGGDEDMGAAMDDMGSAGDDMGVADVDCSPIDADANGQVCNALADSCEVLSLNMTSCNDTCALAGLTCASANDNIDCAPDPAVTADCADATFGDVHCVCER